MPSLYETARSGALLRSELDSQRLELLIVDPDHAVAALCREIANAVGFRCRIAESIPQALRRSGENEADVILMDFKLSGTNGIEALRKLKQQWPDSALIVITGYTTVQTAVQAMREGAFDLLTKPFGVDDLKPVLERAAVAVKSKAWARALSAAIRTQPVFDQIVGQSPAMTKVFRIMGKVAQSSHPVLILGESGTGKELVARAIHYSGPRKDRPFIPVDCGSLVPTLIESELFGYVKGAFTGAVQAKDGLLQIADGGTIFLDEIGELPFDLQSKLLRVLQEKEIRPVGGTKRVSVNVRVLAATNRDLEEAVENGTFRKDLYYRLNVVNIKLPALRERKEDIPEIAARILERLNRDSVTPHQLSPDALKGLMDYPWPGNVRELENSLERAVALTSEPIIKLSDLPTQVQSGRAPTKSPSGDGVVPISDLKRRVIFETLEKFNGDKLKTAAALGIGKTTLYRKLKEYKNEEEK
jgi:two-component system response regulator HydG